MVSQTYILLKLVVTWNDQDPLLRHVEKSELPCQEIPDNSSTSPSHKERLHYYYLPSTDHCRKNESSRVFKTIQSHTLL